MKPAMNGTGDLCERGWPPRHAWRPVHRHAIAMLSESVRQHVYVTRLAPTAIGADDIDSHRADFAPSQPLRAASRLPKRVAGVAGRGGELYRHTPSPV